MTKPKYLKLGHLLISRRPGRGLWPHRCWGCGYEIPPHQSSYNLVAERSGPIIGYLCATCRHSFGHRGTKATKLASLPAPKAAAELRQKKRTGTIIRSCPRCFGPLAQEGNANRCLSCGFKYLREEWPKASPNEETEQDFAASLKAAGWTVTKRGWPDFICFKNGKMVMVEVKTLATVGLDWEQKRVLCALASCGIPCYLWSPQGGFQRVGADGTLRPVADFHTESLSLQDPTE